MLTLSPEGGEPSPGKPPTGGGAFATLAPGPFYVAPVDDTLGLATIYISFALSPRRVAPDKHGIVQMSLPWLLGRSSPRANGFKWLLQPKGGFFESFQVVRDQTLDLSERDELLRPEVDFPHGVEERNSYLKSLQYRRSITNGFLVADFSVSEWYETNGMPVPKASQLEYYLYGGSPKHPYKYPNYKSELKATSLRFDDESVAMPRASVTTHFHDYRYKEMRNKRVFDYADYTLQPGEAWKAANDARLLAARADYLAHGPPIEATASARRVVVWTLFLLLILAPPALMFFRKQKANNTNIVA